MKELYKKLFIGKAGSWGCVFSAIVISSAWFSQPCRAQNCVADPAGLVSWWRGESNAVDTAGSNGGTLQGGAGFATGEVGQAFSFNGTSQYVQIPNNPSLTPSGSFTIEAWIYPLANTANGGIFCKWGDGQVSYNFFTTPGQGLGFYVSDAADEANGSFQALTTTNNVCALSVWTHVAAVYDQSTGTRRVYANGIQITNRIQTPYTIFNGTSPVGIGGIAATSSTGEFFHGSLDEVSYYSRALSAAEIQGIYNAGSAGKCLGPPAIVAQPQNQTVLMGTAANFAVTASGIQPLAYQWQFGLVNIPGATNASLSLTNVQFTNAGNYSVVVSNAYGSTASSNALLTVTSPMCVTAPSGLVSRWAAEGNATDSFGTNSGALINGAGFVTGEVGQAFSFNGSNQYVQIPNNPSMTPTGSFTIEAWIYPLTGTSSGGIFCKWGDGQVSYNFTTAPNQQIQFYVSDAADEGNQSFQMLVTTNNVFNLGAWSHVAGVYDQSLGIRHIYVNGVEITNRTQTPFTVFSGTSPVGIGAIAASGSPGNFFQGAIDEVSYYNRALSAAEIQGIYIAGTAGKCLSAPIITTQPQGQTVPAGSGASFNVAASSAVSLSYQWRLGGTNITGATNATLNLLSVQPTNAGNYSVAISNIYGFTNSANALLTVTTPVCLAPPSGLISWWEAEGTAADSTGTNNGTLRGGAGFALGEVGKAFSFNGTTQCVSIPNYPSLTPAGSFTIEAWVYPLTNGNQNQMIFAKWGDAQVSYDFYVTPGQAIGFGISDAAHENNAAYQLFETPGGVINWGVWSHVAAVYDQSTGTRYIYLNGVQLDSLTQPPITIFNGTSAVGIGAIIGASYIGNLLSGEIDEVSYYGRALSAAEIQGIYSAGSAGKCPSPPVITLQPQGKTVTAGSSVSFTTAASGAAPLSYQWKLGGTNVAAATNASLTITNVQLFNAGNYSVTVSNAYGLTNSSNALLTVYVPVCDSPPSGLVGWWAAEGTAGDSASTNNGTLFGGVTYAPGFVGQAFSVNGANYVQIPDAPNLNYSSTSPMSLECWAYRTGGSTSGLNIIGKRNPSCSSVWEYQFGEDPANGLQFTGGNGSITGGAFTGFQMPSNVWMHLVGTFDGTNFHFYFNGALVASGTGTLGPAISAPFEIGTAGGCSGFVGLLDEVSLYNRALSAAEVQSNYNASSAGKCPGPPVLIAQPQGQKVTAGSSASFAAAAVGAAPLSYQWQLGGVNVPGATNASLTLTNVQPSMAGNYSVTVSNTYGLTNSSSATLKVSVVLVYANGVLLTNSTATYGGSVSIQLQSVYTNGDIFYTLDGTTPTFSSTQYAGPFIVTNSSVLRTLGYSADFTQAGQSDPLSIVIVPNYTLTATTPGGGSISLNPTNGIAMSNSVVSAIAKPASGWAFLQWTGDAGGTNATNNILMTRNKSIQAIFGTSLSTTATGGGSVLLNPLGGIYPYGTTIRLSALPQAGNYFVLWGNAASGNLNPLSFVLTNANPSVSSLFAALSGGQVSLAVIPLGHGQVSINPQANAYTAGQGVMVTATPDAGQAFLNWSGDASGAQNPLSVTMTTNKIIYANFSKNHSLTLQLEPGGLKEGVDLMLNGEFGTAYRVDASTNLSTSNWVTLFSFTNSVGTINYIDNTTSNFNLRFYRGVPLP